MREINEERYQKASLIVTSQVEPQGWIKLFEDPGDRRGHRGVVAVRYLKANLMSKRSTLCPTDLSLLPRRRQNPKLLIVEDDDIMRTQMRWALAEEYEVCEAEDRETALEVFRNERPALVTLDLGLPPAAQGAEEGVFLALGAILDIGSPHCQDSCSYGSHRTGVSPERTR